MAKTPKFVYAMILLLSIFLIKIVSGSNTLLAFRECVYDKDCPVMPRCNMRCRKGVCIPVRRKEYFKMNVSLL
ncbi:Nodule Cysteine-Rich (NCR) secreted peptide [Medicago truncatula]|uniref:Nodule Cysteine-Rich (NCR) secreted peptide n=1 Tax=Medicago truncatula TaxID=3880 RepID=A0A072U9U0_MEDTR|nr:Nodule Cysteine-Rich (NCR) secreted peptide [Medicago truncatula]